MATAARTKTRPPAPAPRPLKPSADATPPLVSAVPRAPHLNVLVLQGGGALGAYHLGVCEALAEMGIAPDWVAGISIGAINAALIAGNPPGRRLQALATFWERISSGLIPAFPLMEGMAQDAWSQGAALWIATMGVPGFFKPRFPPSKLQPRGSMGAISHYDTEPLRRTLDELIDWDLLNDGPIRLSVGAVSVTTGRMHFFDTQGGMDHVRMSADHVIASGALPPGFPPVKIGDDWFWDGGIASNAPLQHVLDVSSELDKNIFQVDLFPAEGEMPQTMLDAETRAQDIRYSSRTRLGTNLEMTLAPVRMVMRHVLEQKADELTGFTPEQMTILREFAYEQRIEIAHIVYRDKAYSGKARGYEFSRPTMEAHRAAGRRDASRALEVRDWNLAPTLEGVHCVDVGQPVELRGLKPKITR